MNTSYPVTEKTLYIVATPIGNLSDITARAIDVLRSVNIIACEDTRTSAKLLNNFGISTKTWAYHEHNADIQTDKLIDIMMSGDSIALISDAGTPLISDPGFQLVRKAHEHHIKVVPIVGASAVVGALSVAGLPSDKFSFMGFLPAKSSGRQKQLSEYSTRTETLIFYEAPHRIVDCLSDMAEILGADREATLCRELTKTFETIYKSTLQDLILYVKNDPNQQKGEIVLVVEGMKNSKKSDDMAISKHDPLLCRLLEDLSVKKSATLAAEITGIKKNALYQRLLILQQNDAKG